MTGIGFATAYSNRVELFSANHRRTKQLQMGFLLGRMSPLARVRHLSIILQMRQCFK